MSRAREPTSRLAPPVTRLVVAVVLGAMTTVAVSWALALWQPIDGEAVSRVVSIPPGLAWRPDRKTGQLWLLRGPGFEWHYLCCYNDGPRPARWWMPRSSDTEVPIESLVRPWARGLICPWMEDRRWPTGAQSLLAVVGRGWPLPALWSRYASTRTHSGQLVPFDHALSVPGRTFEARAVASRLAAALPLGPIWTGLAADTGLYAAAWLLLLAAPGIIRRRLRLQRGRCPACGYSLAGLVAPVCPECGNRGVAL